MAASHRRVQILDKVKSRLEIFLKSHAVMHASSEGRGVQGLELLCDGLKRLLQVLDSNFNVSDKTTDSEATIEEEEKVFAALLASINTSPQDANSVTLAHHILTTAIRALIPSPSASTPPDTLAHSHTLPQFSTPSRTALSEKRGSGSGGGMGLGMEASGGSGPGTPLSTSHDSSKHVARMQQEVSRLQQKLRDALAEVQKVGAAAAASSALAEVAARAEADAVAARGAAAAVHEREVKKVTCELGEERKDCSHFKDLCEQLRCVYVCECRPF